MNTYVILVAVYLFVPFVKHNTKDSSSRTTASLSKKVNALNSVDKGADSNNKTARYNTKNLNQKQSIQKLKLPNTQDAHIKPTSLVQPIMKIDSQRSETNSNVRLITNENLQLRKKNKTLDSENHALKNQSVLKSSSYQDDFSKFQKDSFIADSIIVSTLLLALLFTFLLWRKTSKLKIELGIGLQNLQNMKQIPNAPSPIKPSSYQPNISRHVKTALSNSPSSFSNIFVTNQNNNNSPNWYIVAASAIGKSHISNNMPCQDNHYCENFGNGWGIAISCDGAGSAENSSIGSEFVVKEAFKVFKEVIYSNKYINKQNLPSEKEWKILTKESFNAIALALEEFAKSKHLDFDSVACTLIVVIYSPLGLLVAHIGDGRAGYCNENNEWKSIITPHKGEEANQTIFITSRVWRNSDNYSMSGVTVPESRVIHGRPLAFTAMSDGCESHSFDCSKMDPTNNKWEDPNVPYPKFFNPLVATLKEMQQKKVSLADASIKWKTFVEEGTSGLKEESDDKTLILGILN